MSYRSGFYKKNETETQQKEDGYDKYYAESIPVLSHVLSKSLVSESFAVISNSVVSESALHLTQ